MRVLSVSTIHVGYGFVTIYGDLILCTGPTGDFGKLACVVCPKSSTTYFHSIYLLRLLRDVRIRRRSSRERGRDGRRRCSHSPRN